MHCEVSTLPATTAAGGTGSSIEPRGTTIVQRPQAAGVQRNRLVDQRAEHVQHRGDRHRARRIEIVRLLRRRAREVDASPCRVRASTRDADLDRLAVVELVAEMAVAQPPDRATHAVARRCPARAACRPAASLRPCVVRGALEFARAACVGCELRAQVGEVLRKVARRPGPAAEQRCSSASSSAPVTHDALRRDQRAFLARCRGCRAASSPA